MLPYLSNSSIKLETQLGSNANQLFVSVDFLNLPQYVHMTASLSKFQHTKSTTSQLLTIKLSPQIPFKV